jgi:hypothetical protein
MINISPKVMGRIEKTGKQLSKIKPQEKKGKLTVKFKEGEDSPSYGMMVKGLGYERVGNKKGMEVYDKPKGGEPTAKKSKVTLRPGQSADKYAPEGEGWESKQVGNKIVYTRSKTDKTAKSEMPSEMTAEQRESQMRGRQNTNEMQYRGSENPESNTESQKFVVKMKKEKSGSDGGSSTTSKERKESRRSLKVMCKGDSKSRGGCAIGPRRESKAKY